MKAALAVILFSILAWAINGEMKARLLDSSLGLTATRCTPEGPESPIPASAVLSNMSGHELLYVRIRNGALKDCSGPGPQEPRAIYRPANPRPHHAGRD